MTDRPPSRALSVGLSIVQGLLFVTFVGTEYFTRVLSFLDAALDR